MWLLWQQECNGSVAAAVAMTGNALQWQRCNSNDAAAAAVRRCCGSNAMAALRQLRQQRDGLNAVAVARDSSNATWR
jgi:hypothetical protein